MAAGQWAVGRGADTAHPNCQTQPDGYEQSGQRRSSGQSGEGFCYVARAGGHCNSCSLSFQNSFKFDNFCVNTFCHRKTKKEACWLTPQLTLPPLLPLLPLPPLLPKSTPSWTCSAAGAWPVSPRWSTSSGSPTRSPTTASRWTPTTLSVILLSIFSFLELLRCPPT